MLDKRLNYIKSWLEEALSKDQETLRKEVFDRLLDKKLDISYENYKATIAAKMNYILSRNKYLVIKSINKMLKNKENEEDYEFED